MQAIRLVKKTPPQLIILDVRLPDGSGYDQAILDTHGGQAHAENTAHGTIFILLIPLFASQ